MKINYRPEKLKIPFHFSWFIKILHYISADLRIFQTTKNRRPGSFRSLSSPPQTLKVRTVNALLLFLALLIFSLLKPFCCRLCGSIARSSSPCRLYFFCSMSLIVDLLLLLPFSHAMFARNDFFLLSFFFHFCVFYFFYSTLHVQYFFNIPFCFSLLENE